MFEHAIRNSFIGIKEQCRNYYIESVDLSNNINKKSLSEFLLTKNTIEPLIKNTNYFGFCLDCKKNTNDSACKNHSIYYFKDIIQNMDNIQQMELKLEKTKNSFNNVINIINQRLQYFIKRNLEQLSLIEKIINSYKEALNSNNLTYQMLFNIKNILNINNLDLYSFTNEDTPINLKFNFLNSCPIDNILKDHFNFERVQRNTEINYKDKIKSILPLEKNGKLIMNTDYKLFLVNPKDFTSEHTLTFTEKIIAINIMKNKENIFLSCVKSIAQIKINENSLIIEQILNNISISYPGIIVGYKNEIAWNNEYYICFRSNEKFNIYDSFEELDSFEYPSIQLELHNIFQYLYDNILFIYQIHYATRHGDHGCFFKLGLYNKNKSYFKDCIWLEKSENFKFFDFKENHVMISAKTSIDIIDVLHWKNIKKISMPSKLSINKVFSMINNYFILFLEEGNYFCYDIDDYYEEMMDSKFEENKEIEILIIKLDECILNSGKKEKRNINIEDYKENIKLKTKFLIKRDEELFCYLFKNEKRIIHQIISKDGPSKINSYEIIMNIEKTLTIKKDK